MKCQSAKAVTIRLTVHRLTGSKEAANYLHQCGHGILYAYSLLLNTDWENRKPRNSSHNLSFRKEKQ